MREVHKPRLKLKRRSEISMKRNNKSIWIQGSQLREGIIEDITMKAEEKQMAEEKMPKFIKRNHLNHLNTRNEMMEVPFMEKEPKSPEIMKGTIEEMIKAIHLKKGRSKSFKYLLRPFLKFL
jgi:hypothetical protein